MEKRPKKAEDLPLARERMTEIRASIGRDMPFFFLDFDGTLSPIVADHSAAGITEEVRELVSRLHERYPVAVISGRGLSDVRSRMRLPGIYYAGSHGYELSGPHGYVADLEEAARVIPVLDKLEPLLNDQLEAIGGVKLERKKYSLAIHYRQVAPDRVGEVHRLVAQCLGPFPQILKAGGKKVIELRPALDWHKGKAVALLCKELESTAAPVPIYLGDDLTDEDVFKHLDKGLGILVGAHGSATWADLRLKDQEEVAWFLQEFLEVDRTD